MLARLREFAAEAGRLRRRLMRVDHRLAEDYLRRAATAKLHIGSGADGVEGWLNADIIRAPGVMMMDATGTFPFSDGVFDYVFSEHMIEHVTYAGAQNMLRECHRVMKPDGVIRIVTPDLGALMSLCAEPKSELAARYLEFFYEVFLPKGHPATPVAVLNAHFRLWGHEFLYDEAALAHALREAGFRDIVRRPLGASDHAALKNMENELRYPPGLLALESVALEGRR